jgi:hypothetical protein
MKRLDTAGGERYRAQDLLTWARALLRAAGLPDERAEVVARVLLEGDLLGHTTHGLDLLPGYLQELDEGRMARVGKPETLHDSGPPSPGTGVISPEPGSWRGRSPPRGNGSSSIPW